ncbi:galectin [Aphelenchoides avenae]|nr:galectin [Aphelenchus avenae]
MQVIENPPIPFTVPLQGLQYNAEIELEGAVIPGHEKCFVVELCAGNDVALHLSARFGYMGESAIVLNTQQSGKWQEEERHGNKLGVGEPFRLQIVNHEKNFLVRIHLNGQNLCQFKHIVPATSIASLKIRGDLKVHKVTFRGFPNPTSTPPQGLKPNISGPSNPTAPYPYGPNTTRSGAMLEPGALPPPPYSAYPTTMPVPHAAQQPGTFASSPRQLVEQEQRSAPSQGPRPGMNGAYYPNSANASSQGPRPGKNGPYYPNAPYPYGQNTTRSGEIPLMPNPTSSSFQGPRPGTNGPFYTNPTSSPSQGRGPYTNGPSYPNAPYPYEPSSTGSGPFMPATSGGPPPPSYSAYPTTTRMPYAARPPGVFASAPPQVDDEDCHYGHHYDYHCDPCHDHYHGHHHHC